MAGVRTVGSASRQPVGGVLLTLWRGAVGFRLVSLALCLYLIAHWYSLYARPGVAVAVGAAEVVVTAVIAVAGWTGRAHRLGLVVADSVVVAILTLITMWAQTSPERHGGMSTLTTIWQAGPAIELGFVAGWAGGLVGAVAQFVVSLVVRDGSDVHTWLNGALIVITGTGLGYVAVRARRAELTVAAAESAAAVALERERLARSIHDGVLQVLGLVHRQGLAAGGQWAELGAAAATQEAALRALITSQDIAPAAGMPASPSLLGGLTALRSDRVTVSVPASAPDLAPHTVGELLAVVQAALHNVDQHAGAGAHAWVLLEEVGEELCVTVRDDGAGTTVQRLADQEAAGRMGVARSIRGRAADLGGTVEIRTAPGEGMELEIRIPIPHNGSA